MKSYSTELYHDQAIDHYGTFEGTYRQRYFVNDTFWKNDGTGSIFFYLGNEANVELYLNATGLMWENAPGFNALIIFCEHRYYGLSTPFGDDMMDNLEYLTVEQALYDYANVVTMLKEEYEAPVNTATIGFGGSYGGMLATWARIKYPHVFDGVIAGSAPVVSFEGMTPAVEPGESYAEGVTYDVGPSGGVTGACEVNLRLAFEQLKFTDMEEEKIAEGLRLCGDWVNSTDLGWDATNWLNEALSYMAMGNFPYPSSYILNGAGLLPAFPVRVACSYLEDDMTEDVDGWLEGLKGFAGVYYNYTGELECNELSAPVNEESLIVNTLWNYQYCTEIFQIFGQSPSPTDMFWDAPWDGNVVADNCKETYGFYPDRTHFADVYGSPVDWAETTSNIVWSQGEYDPWRGGGVQEDLSDTLKAVVIPEAAHHLDLFFSNEGDTAAVKEARQLELDSIKTWIEEKRERE